MAVYDFSMVSKAALLVYILKRSPSASPKLSRASFSFSGEEKERKYCYPPHIFAKCFTVAGSKYLKLDIGVGTVFSEFHDARESNDMTLRKEC